MRGRRGRSIGTLVASAVVGLVLSACSSAPGSEPGSAPAVEPPRAAIPTDLRWRISGEDVVCDGTERKAGTVEDAAPGETIDFASPMPVEVAAGRADEDGRYELFWSCRAEEAGLRWELTATGARSGRSVGFVVDGAAPTAADGPLAIDLYDEGVVCDGLDHEVGVVGGLAPGEVIELTSSDGDGRDPGPADSAGDRVFGWRCRPGDVGRIWHVTARSVATGRTIDFALEGVAPTDDRPLAIESAINEVPCDGRVHTLATVVNLFPDEIVSFTAPGATTELRDGRASADGRLDLRWQCGRADAGRTWELTVRATETGKTTSLSFTGSPGPPPVPATVRLVEDPFVCDGGRRPVAVLSNLDQGEFVDFASPQADGLREGRFTGGELAVNWQCRPDQAGMVWEVTATGRQSGRSVTFEIVGVAG